MHKPISIGIFEEDDRLLSLLHKSLAPETYKVASCAPLHDSLLDVLESITIQWTSTQTSHYDLLIIEMPATQLVGKTFVALENLVALKNIHIILLTETISDERIISSENVSLLPIVFHRFFSVLDLFKIIEEVTDIEIVFTPYVLQMIAQWQHEQYAVNIQYEQDLLDEQKVWLKQRQEWTQQRQDWLYLREEWLLRVGTTIHPQYAWLDEQHAWIKDQQNENDQQMQWLHDRETWLLLKQRELDSLKQSRPFILTQ